MNLADAAMVRQQLCDIAPTIIVNPAAYIVVDKTESEPEVERA